MKIRLLPALILVTSLTLVIKLGGLYHSIGVAFAQGTATLAAQPAATPAAAQPAAVPAATQGAAKDGANGTAKPGAEAPAPNKPPRLTMRDGGKETASFTPAEVEILQALSERRAEIDRRAEEVNQREILLKATEQRINERITKLEEIQKTVDGLLKKYDEQEDTKIKSLVRIYENMKPKEAARIFEQMEMPVLLSVVDRMKERIVASVLASMDPEKAKQVTVALAEKRTLPTVAN
jgi:flagellar motility protein MotE (MotC chaperone)